MSQTQSKTLSSLTEISSKTVYVLKCQDNRYYVGSTSRPIPHLRILEHFRGEGSEWTRHFPPIEVIEIKENADDFDEDKYTKKYMAKYGIENVRGAAYSKLELSNDETALLQKEICSASDACFRCLRKGHLAKDCRETCYSGGSRIPAEKYEENYEEKETSHAVRCLRCWREGHIAPQCYANISPFTHYNVRCVRCGRAGHYSVECYANTHISGYRLYY